MKILFFLPVSPVSNGHLTSHNGGGWTTSFLKKFSEQPGNQAAAVYEGDGAWGASDDRGVILYPINIFHSLKNKLKRKFSPALEETLLLPLMKKAVADFAPDVIHIFGSENPFGLICSHTDVPCIIHIQGFLPSYYNAKYPPGISKNDFILKLLWNPVRLYRFLWMDSVFARRAKREIGIFRDCSAFFGRTEWDQAIVDLFHPGARYFYCSEILRSEFYEAQGRWEPPKRAKKILVSTLSTPLYKGHDLILKTAKLLCDFADIDFEWRIFGGADFSFWSGKLKISPQKVNVSSCGVASAETLRNELLNADLYVHPSYIDNSPNSVCEAQILGIPVVAVNAGGVSSLVENGKSGLLVPANDPVMLAEKIKDLLSDQEKAGILSRNEVESAAKRHDPDAVIRSALSAYGELLKGGK